MHSRLARGFVTTKSTVLFTAPPASAWQLCLPVLYLIPPAKLALRISLPDPWACRQRRPLCPPRWLRPGSLGSALGELRGRAGLGQGWSPRRLLFQAPGAGAYPTPSDFTPTWHTAALCWLPSPPNSDPDCQLLGGGRTGVVRAFQMELVSVILHPNSSPQLCLSGRGGNWQALGGGFHPLPLLRAQHT